MAKLAVMKPINSIIWVTKSTYIVLTPEEICEEKVGEKAYGLAALPSSWTLPFFVISDNALEEYEAGGCDPDVFFEWEDTIEKAAADCGIYPDDSIIVRSNAHTEGLDERGKYTSVEGTLREWPLLVERCFKLNIESGGSCINMPLIIQKRAKSLLRGHISNERRVAKEIRDWKGEIDVSLPQMFSVSLRNWRSKINVASFIDSPLVCPGDKEVRDILAIPCTWATNQKLRVHFEWVFDGDCIYLVQADEALELDGIDPTKIVLCSELSKQAKKTEALECLHLLKDEDYEKYQLYSKIQNPLLYKKLGLEIAPLYILDDIETLTCLEKGEIREELRKDLEFLTKQSLIIRTDINTCSKEERQLLPRTCEIRNIDEAIDWLKTNYAELRQRTKSEIIFILHNYIPAVSSAFAYASPNDNIVRMEALWGLPEGLYYYSHDKFVVDTKNSDILKIDSADFEIEKILHYKKYFVCPMENGEWVVQVLSAPYDWKPSIQDDSWIKEIASKTRAIAEAESTSVSVMWFVGVEAERYGCEVFPWFHEAFAYNEEKTTPRNKLTFEKTFTIHTLRDIEEMEAQSRRGKGIVRNILIQPTDAQILRQKEIIDRIGTAAQAIDANIILEGGILSHAYYQLLRTGAKVEVRNTFSKVQNLDHNKLVRDKIPEKIERNGEAAVTVQLEKSILGSFLKRKLVEESLEVLDAEDPDDIIAELADVLEVIDGILQQQGIDMQEVLMSKERKREKVGGFEKGVYLKKTSSSTASRTGKIIVEDASITDEQKVARSTDLRRYPTANESFTRVKIPITMNKWEINPTVKAENVDIVIKGERKQGNLQVEISVFEQAEQLSLFVD